MRLDDVTDVLDALDDIAADYWVGGGWGVAALVGRQTRDHRDLDLAIRADDLDRVLSALAKLGYAPQTDWLPVRIELAGPGEKWVDLHPVVFDASGHGRQVGLAGSGFDYPPSALTTGRLADRVVPCLSAGQQRTFRSGYELREQDHHDLAQLDALDDIGRNPRPGVTSDHDI